MRACPTFPISFLSSAISNFYPDKISQVVSTNERAILLLDFISFSFESCPIIDFKKKIEGSEIAYLKLP